MPTGNNEDTELLSRFQQRDRNAFDQLFDRYAGRLLAFCVQITGNQAEAEDLVSETFLALYQTRTPFRGGARLLTYLIAIARRRNRDRKRRPLVDTVPLQEETDVLRRTHRTAADQTEGLALEAALATLDEPLRVAFQLVAVQGLTHKEAAAILQAPVGTIKWRVAEATKRLRAALQEENDHEPFVAKSTALPTLH